MKITDTHVFFWGGPFSNWAPGNFTAKPTPLAATELEFNCGEQFMMLNKALLFNDFEIAQLVMEAKDPATQKKLGRKVRDFALRLNLQREVECGFLLPLT